MFSCQTCKIFRNTYFEEHTRTTASKNVKYYVDNSFQNSVERDVSFLGLNFTRTYLHNIFFKDFGNTLRKCKIKASWFREFRDGCLSKRIAMLNFIWKGRVSNRSRRKGVLRMVILENNCLKMFWNFLTQNSCWSSWFSKDASWYIEPYDFIIFCQGDFPRYFSKSKWFHFSGRTHRFLL